MSSLNSITGGAECQRPCGECEYPRYTKQICDPQDLLFVSVGLGMRFIDNMSITELRRILAQRTHENTVEVKDDCTHFMDKVANIQFSQRLTS